MVIIHCETAHSWLNIALISSVLVICSTPVHQIVVIAFVVWVY